ncbi:MAG: PKD domain-containing protein [Candidatus Saliniplasma sp.]
MLGLSSKKTITILAVTLITISTAIAIFPSPPEADAGDFIEVLVGETVDFDASGSSGRNLRYNWFFSDFEEGAETPSFDSGNFTPQVQHTFNRAGVYEVVLFVEELSGPYNGDYDKDTVTVVVKEEEPEGHCGIEESYMNVDMTLRVAGKKWYDVEMELYEDDEVIEEFYVIRDAGDPDEQSDTVEDIILDITKNYTTKAYYTPGNSTTVGQRLGANPAWIDIEFEDGDWERLHHTFNVEHNETHNWTENINKAIMGNEITFEAIGFDWGIEQNLTFKWDFGDGSTIENIYNQTEYGSEYYTLVQDMVYHTYTSEGTFELNLTIEGDGEVVDYFTATVTNDKETGLMIDGLYEEDFLNSLMIVGKSPRGSNIFLPSSSEFLFTGNMGTLTPFDFDGVMVQDQDGDYTNTTYGWELKKNGSPIDSVSGESYTFEDDESGTYTLTFEVDHNDTVRSSSVYLPVIKDSDNDGIPDVYEKEISNTDPYDEDTDGDGIPDPLETFVHETDPLSIDTDGDGLTDFKEIYGTHGFISDPTDPDTSGDGLPDGEARYSMTFDNNERVDLSSSSTDITIEDVWVKAPTRAIEQAELRIGVKHSSMDDVELVLQSGEKQEELTMPDDVGEHFYASFDILEDTGFVGSDLVDNDEWTLTVEDGGNGDGYVEYVELNVVMWTDPSSVDSNGDGLSDKEQLRRGEYGWLTDPWNEDTAGSGVSDYKEIKGWSWTEEGEIVQDDDGFRTNPMVKDTDGDGVQDGQDIDPFHELAVKVTILDIDRSGSDYFATIDFTQGEDGKNIATERGSDAAPSTYTFHVDDDIYEAEVGINIQGWDEEGWVFKEDEVQESIVLDYNLISQETIEGTGGSDDFEISYKIETITLEKANTLLVNATDGEVYETESGELRYTGEQKFYTAMLEVDQGGEVFKEGPNQIVVSRNTFGESYLNQVLTGDEEDLPEIIEDLEFSYTDEEKDTASGAVVGIISGEVSYDDAEMILEMILHSGENSEEQIANYTVLDTPVNIGLAPDVIRLIPWTGFVMDDQGSGPGSWSDFFGEWLGYLADAAELLKEGLVAIGNFIVNLGEAIVDWGMAVVGAIGDAFSAVRAAVSEVGEMMSALADWIVSHISSLFSSVWETVTSGLESWAEGIQEAMENFFEELAEWNEINGSESMDDTMEAGTELMLSFIGQQDRASDLMGVMEKVMRFIEPFQQYMSPFGAFGVIMEVVQFDSQGLSEVFNTVIGGISGGIQDVWEIISDEKSPLYDILSEEIDIPVSIPTTNAINNFYDQIDLDNPIINTLINLLPNGSGKENRVGDILLLSTGSLLLGMGVSAIDIEAASAPILQGFSWVLTITGAILEYEGHWSSLIVNFFSAFTGYLSEVLFWRLGVTEPLSLLLLAISPTIGLGITTYHFIN